MQEAILDLAFLPKASDVSHIDILTPLGTSNPATLSIHRRRSKAAPVGARRRPDVWRIPFEKMRAAVADCDNMD